MTDLSKIGIALLAGITAGLVAGVLLAPDEGAKTRKKLAKKARKYEEKMKEKASLLKEKANAYANKATHAKDDFVKTAESYL